MATFHPCRQWASSQFVASPAKWWSSISLGILSTVAILLISGCAPRIPVFGLRPEYPEVSNDFVEVDSLQPTLRWQAFPRPEELEADHESVLRRIQNITYELKIARAEDDFPVEIVYTREDIPTPHHALEEPLQPSTQYFWTVRARFELDGQPRVTEWGVTDPSARRLVPIPNPSSFRFETPSE